MTAADVAYAEVERLTRERARNFAYGIMLLPRERRRAIAAIYAFARMVDDIADDPELADDEKRSRLEAARAGLSDREPADPMLVALADARRRYPIPDDALHALVDGGVRDTEQSRYADFDELHGYCRLVAGAVGRACVPVYGAPEEGARGEVLGVGLQLINIIRDVREDWALGRVYLPQDELAEYGVTEDDIAVGRSGTEWRALMEFQAARARSFVARGVGLVEKLDGRSRACVVTFARLYLATLDRIEESGFDVFAGPPQLSAITKLRIAGTGLLR
jgi:phytoene synthase